MTPEPRLVQVEIFGQPYRLRADEDPTYVETLATYVDGRMREVARQTKAVDSLKVAVLTALNIADEHHRHMKEARERAESRAAGGDAGTVSGRGDAGRRSPTGEEIQTRITEWSHILDEALGG